MTNKNQEDLTVQEEFTEVHPRVLSVTDVPAFQTIARLLVDFDERTGRHTRYSDPESHLLRKAVTVARPEDLTVTVSLVQGFRDGTASPEEGAKVDGTTYMVRVDYRGHDEKTVGNSFTTSWLHEDGIKAERRTLGADHPVHKIVCLTDLYDVARPAGVDFLSEEEEVQR